MAIDVVWDDDSQSILRWDFSADWSWDEYQLAFDRSLEMVSSVSHRVDVIPNVIETQKLPAGALAQFKRVYDNSPDNTHLILITGGNSFVNAVIKTFARVYRIPTWRTARTLADAREMIRQDRQQMPGGE
jgi:hypothetical protein